MNQLINREDAVKLLERVVAERGADFVYEYPRELQTGNGTQLQCFYEHEGAPSCAIGLALSYIGVTPEQLAELDDLGEDHGETAIDELMIIGHLRDKCDIIIEDEAVFVFSKFQCEQDLKQRYGTALQRALLP
jgi:hypothetical protein